jgi:hypothetical protein
VAGHRDGHPPQHYWGGGLITCKMYHLPTSKIPSTVHQVVVNPILLWGLLQHPHDQAWLGILI